MSTRSQVEFRVISRGRESPVFPETEGKPYEIIERRTIYRHSDGYPSGIIPDIVEFVKWNLGRMSDAEYTAANWIFFNKRQHEEWQADYAKKGMMNYKKGSKYNWHKDEDGNSLLKIGFGVCNNDELHGDIAYYYRVTLEEEDGKERVITIECYRPHDEIVMRRDKLLKVIADLAHSKPQKDVQAHAILREYGIDPYENCTTKVDFDKPFAKVVLDVKGNIKDVVGFWFDKKTQEIKFEESEG